MDFSWRSSHLCAIVSLDRQCIASLTHPVLMSCAVGESSLFTSSTMFSDPKISCCCQVFLVCASYYPVYFAVLVSSTKNNCNITIAFRWYHLLD